MFALAAGHYIGYIVRITSKGKAVITVQQHRLYLAALAVAEALEREAQCYLDRTVLQNDVEDGASSQQSLRETVMAHDAAKIELSACRSAYREIAAKVSASEAQRSETAIEVADAFMAIHEGKDEGARFAQAMARYRNIMGKE